MPNQVNQLHLEDDWSAGRVYLDDLVYHDASVDGQGGEIRDKPVFTIEEAAYYLNRGIGVQEYDGNFYNSGANWAGAQGTADNEWYFLAQSKGTAPGQALTELAFGFYETRATLPDPYVYTRLSDGTNAQYIGMAVAVGLSAFDADQREATRQAIESWDDLIAVTFVEKHFNDADLNFMNSTTGPIQASAYLPYDYGATTIIQDDGTPVTYAEISGDVFVNPNQASNHLFDEGQYGLTTLIHEIGHSLGLEHPGDYNFGPGFAVNYENGAEYYQDSGQYSIMSYWDSEETGANHVDWKHLTYRYGSTPAVHDVAAIQRIYGADMTTRTGDTVYGFNSNAGNDSFDFVATPMPVVTIWDAGGNDTLDLSGFDTPSIIDINPGAFTSAGGFLSADIPTLAEINARRVADGLTPRDQATYDVYLDLFGDHYTNGLMTDNIAIAYGAVIENATGGSGDDSILGNAASNILKGGAGNDTLKGGDDVDYFTGGAGSDTIVAEINSVKVGSKDGNISLDVVLDFKSGQDKIDLSGIDAKSTEAGNQAFNFVNSSSGKNAGDVYAKTFGNMSAAESSTGMNLDGADGASLYSGKVTVIFGNTDGDKEPEFAIALVGVDSINTTDFIYI